jgi:hypothetical protein
MDSIAKLDKRECLLVISSFIIHSSSQSKNRVYAHPLSLSSLWAYFCKMEKLDRLILTLLKFRSERQLNNPFFRISLAGYRHETGKSERMETVDLLKRLSTCPSELSSTPPKHPQNVEYVYYWVDGLSTSTGSIEPSGDHKKTHYVFDISDHSYLFDSLYLELFDRSTFFNKKWIGSAGIRLRELLGYAPSFST